MKFVATIEVQVKEAKDIQEILNIKEGNYDKASSNAVITTYSCVFSNGFSADIKVCNGNTPYVDSVLIDKQGCEMEAIDISETLLGIYAFEFEGDRYEVTVEESEESAYSMRYLTSRKGISLFSSEPVDIIGERTVSYDGKMVEQFLYNLVGYQPENGKPFVSLKANIILE